MKSALLSLIVVLALLATNAYVWRNEAPLGEANGDDVDPAQQALTNPLTTLKIIGLPTSIDLAEFILRKPMLVTMGSVTKIQI